MNSVPVITLDGPGGAGKGTLGRKLARRLGFHFLDSGLLYRALAIAVQKQQEAYGRELERLEVIEMANHLPLQFGLDEIGSVPVVMLNGHDIGGMIKQETVGNQASQYGAIPEVRAALLERQRAFCVSPGLVADGRDMGTIVFPEACLKFFITASAQERAQRRMKELQTHGIHANLAALLGEIEARDTRDQQRAVAPLVPAVDAHIIDTTGQGIEAVFEQVWQIVSKHLKHGV